MNHTVGEQFNVAKAVEFACAGDGACRAERDNCRAVADLDIVDVIDADGYRLGTARCIGLEDISLVAVINVEAITDTADRDINRFTVGIGDQRGIIAGAQHTGNIIRRTADRDLEGMRNRLNVAARDGGNRTDLSGTADCRELVFDTAERELVAHTCGSADNGHPIVGISAVVNLDAADIDDTCIVAGAERDLTVDAVSCADVKAVGGERIGQ